VESFLRPHRLILVVGPVEPKGIEFDWDSAAGPRYNHLHHYHDYCPRGEEEEEEKSLRPPILVVAPVEPKGIELDWDSAAGPRGNHLYHFHQYCPREEEEVE
jgi:hypothetical protein